MNINKFNSEGYYDPTVYEALTQIEKESKNRPYMPIVYICSPYSGNVEENIKKAREYCRYAIDNGYIPIAMHLLLPQFMDDNNPKERNLALIIDMIIMSKCQEIWVCDNHITEGMSVEIAKAKKRKQKIRYFNATYEEV